MAHRGSEIENDNSKWKTGREERLGEKKKVKELLKKRSRVSASKRKKRK